MPGYEFGPYHLVDLLGRGGMGEVYRATDSRKGNREVALKVLPIHLADDINYQTRFRREADIVARLNEPHVIPIHDYGEINGQLFIDMRLVHGRDLAHFIAAEGPMSPEIAVAVISQVAGALDAAHAANIAHRDVKPSNVLVVEPNFFCYLVDFGIARSVDGTVLTASGGVVGTPAYMAPERFIGGDDGHLSDVYALGCLLFEMLTGRPPFTGDALSLMYAHVNSDPPRSSTIQNGVSSKFDTVIARGMAKDVTQRFQRAGDLAEAARRALQSGSDGRSRPHRTSAVKPQAVYSEMPRLSPLPFRRPGKNAESTFVPDGASLTAVVAGSDEKAARRLKSIGIALVSLVLLGAVAIGLTIYNGTSSAPSSGAAGANSGGSLPIGAREPGSIERLRVAFGPVDIAFAEDNSRAYALGADSRSISIIDVATGEFVDALGLGMPEQPYSLVVSPDGATVYVTLPDLGAVAVVSVSRDRDIELLSVGGRPFDIEISPSGDRVYVANQGSMAIDVVDTATLTVLDAVSVRGFAPTGLALSKDGVSLYVLHMSSERLVTVVDTETLAVVEELAVGDVPADMAISPDGRRAYIAQAGSDSEDATVLDLTSGQIVSSIAVGAASFSVATSPDGTIVYLLATGLNLLIRADASTGQVLTQIQMPSNCVPDSVEVDADGLIYVACREDEVIVTVAP